MSDARAALERVLASLCGADESGPFLAAWGEAVPSPLGGRRLRIADPHEPAFAWLDVRPWDEGAIGGVDVAFADGAQPTLEELEAWLGALRETPAIPDAPATLAAEWWRPGLPVQAWLDVEVPAAAGARVERVHVRRGRSAPSP